MIKETFGEKLNQIFLKLKKQEVKHGEWHSKFNNLVKLQQFNEESTVKTWN